MKDKTVTVCTPFGPRKPWVADVWKQGVLNLSLPDDAQFILYNNTGDKYFLDPIQEWLNQINPTWFSIILQDGDTSSFCALNQARPIAIKLNRYWQDFIDLADTDYIISLEHDVVPKWNTYNEFVKNIEETENAGAIAAPAKTRHRAHKYVTMVRQATSGFSNFAFMTPKETGLEECGWSSICCVLFKTEILKSYQVEETDGFMLKRGLEGALMRHVWLSGQRTYVNWGYSVNHYQDEKNYV